MHRELNSRDQCDVVVVGSGPAGAAAISILIRAGVDVTLLEAGSAQKATGLTARVAGITVLRIHRRLFPRTDGLRVAGDPATVLFEELAPGGLSNHWSCAVPRFSTDDFLDARRAGEAFTWPIDYGDLAPWYEWLEPHLRVSGSAIDVPPLPACKVSDVRSLSQTTWAPIAMAAAREGQAIVPVPYAYGGRTTLTPSGTVFNAFVRMVKPALRSGHLTIRYGATVTELEWSGAKKRVEAVLFRDHRTGQTERIRCRAVVLAAGAINSTAILLQSTSPDFSEGLGNEHDVLGRYLHDHPLGKFMVDVSAPMSFRPAAYVTRLPIDRTAPLYAAACLQWSGASKLARSVISGSPGRSASLGFSVFGTMAPSENNRVTLDRSRPSSDRAAGLVLDIRHPPESATALEAARDQLTGLLETAGLRPKSQVWLVDPVGGAIHFAGSCRMHASPRFGMLDRWSRMHAVPNVAVADSAAFTTGPEKNPVLTAMALAARASQRLVEDLRSGVI
ncbi:MAG: GMC family oxidoreductase [Vicinamibacterales bacterium]